MRASHIRGNEPFCGGASPGPPTPSVLDGLALLDESRPFRPRTPILMITAAISTTSVRALRGGALDFIPKPVDGIYFITSLSHVRFEPANCE